MSRIRKMFGGFVANSVNAALEPVISHTETFDNANGVGYSPARMALVSFLTMFLVLLLVLFVGKWLWNNTLAELIPAIKPAKSIWQILGLAILIALLNPGPCNCA